MFTLLLFPLGLALLWTWASGYHGVNGQDAHDYWRIAREWTAFWAGGERPVMAEHPHGYPIVGALVGSVLGGELFGLRVVSALSFLLIVFTLRSVLSRSSGRSGAVLSYVLLALAACPFLLRYAMMSMSDVPGIALIFWAYAWLVRGEENNGLQFALIAIVLAAVATAVRMAVAPLIGALVIAMFYERTRERRTLWAFMTSAVLSLLVLGPFLGVDELLGTVLQGSPLAEWSPFNLFRRVLHSDDGVLIYRVPNIVYVLSIFVHPGFFPIGVLLLPFVRKDDLSSARARIAAWCVGCYLLFIAGMPFQNDRVLLMALPFVAVVFYPAFLRAWDWLVVKGLRPGLWVSAMAVLQFGLFVRAIQPQIGQARTERMLSTIVNAMHPPRIYTHGMGAAFSNYCAPVPVTELWYAELDSFSSGAAVVVNVLNLKEQWQGLPPATNLERIEEQGVETVEIRREGWVVLRVR